MYVCMYARRSGGFNMDLLRATRSRAHSFAAKRGLDLSRSAPLICPQIAQICSPSLSSNLSRSDPLLCRQICPDVQFFVLRFVQISFPLSSYLSRYIWSILLSSDLIRYALFFYPQICPNQHRSFVLKFVQICFPLLSSDLSKSVPLLSPQIFNWFISCRQISAQLLRNVLTLQSSSVIVVYILEDIYNFYTHICGVFIAQPVVLNINMNAYKNYQQHYHIVIKM